MSTHCLMPRMIYSRADTIRYLWFLCTSSGGLQNPPAQISVLQSISPEAVFTASAKKQGPAFLHTPFPTLKSELHQNNNSLHQLVVDLRVTAMHFNFLKSQTTSQVKNDLSGPLPDLIANTFLSIGYSSTLWQEII